MTPDKPTGADTLVATLADHGVTACFANPGTSEMHLVQALDREPRIRSILRMGLRGYVGRLR
jgi:acetolactate synthase I/II/III large subunit